MRILISFLLLGSFAACAAPDEDPNGTPDVTSDTAIPSENDASVDTDSVDQNDTAETLLPVGSPCALNCDGCCVDGAFCSTYEIGDNCETTTQGTCRIPDDVDDAGGGPYWGVCGCDGVRASGPNAYFQTGGSGPLMACLSAVVDCTVGDADDCEEGSACIASAWDGANYVGACTGIDFICNIDDGYNSPTGLCDYEDRTRCWPGVCEALRDGYQGPIGMFRD